MLKYRGKWLKNYSASFAAFHKETTKKLLTEINVLRAEVSESNRRLGAMTVQRGATLTIPVQLPLKGFNDMEEFDKWLVVDDNLKNMVISFIIFLWTVIFKIAYWNFNGKVCAPISEN